MINQTIQVGKAFSAYQLFGVEVTIFPKLDMSLRRDLAPSHIIRHAAKIIKKRRPQGRRLTRLGKLSYW
jgi:hypothetical protein